MSMPMPSLAGQTRDVPRRWLLFCDILAHRRFEVWNPIPSAKHRPSLNHQPAFLASCRANHGLQNSPTVHSKSMPPPRSPTGIWLSKFDTARCGHPHVVLGYKLPPVSPHRLLCTALIQVRCGLGRVNNDREK